MKLEVHIMNCQASRSVADEALLSSVPCLCVKRDAHNDARVRRESRRKEQSEGEDVVKEISSAIVRIEDGADITKCSVERHKATKLRRNAQEPTAFTFQHPPFQATC